MNDYPKSGMVSDKDLMKAIRKLGDYPDPYDDVRYEIDAAIADDDSDSYGEAMDGPIEEYGEAAVRTILKKYADEQAQEDLKNRHDYEQLEARLAEGSN